MSNVLKMTAALAVVVGFAGVANADEVSGNPAHATAEASVTVVDPITIHNDQSLDFGKIVSNALDGHVIMSASSGAHSTYEGGVQRGPGGTAQGHPAIFTVIGGTDGSGGYQYNLQVSEEVDLEGLTLTPSISTATGFGTTLVYVGGSLEVPGGTDLGTYDGTVTLTATYQ